MEIAGQSNHISPAPALTDCTPPPLHVDIRDPNWADVKLAQARYFLHSLHAFQEKMKKHGEARIPIIVCGDFNSMPGDTVRTMTTYMHFHA